ncbi:MAG: dephospho-CoA kinase [Clostridia bacterium]|nr:dephospho-CoA kinase [Clostridia bacterium]
MKIGLTGSIACGKSTVSSYLRGLGFVVADADAISHELTAPGGAALPLLRAHFGEGVFSGNELDRKKLASLVFSDSEQRKALNAILHPLIIARIQDQLEANDAPDTLVFGDVPLLYECGMDAMFDQIWVVSAPRSTQIARLYERDGLTAQEAAKRIDAQMPLCEKERRADAVISTDGPVEQTRRQVRSLIDAAIQRRQE